MLVVRARPNPSGRASVMSRDMGDILVDRPSLVELLVELGIGVEKRQVEAIRFDSTRLDEDLLQ